MRAAVDDPDLIEAAGFSTVRLAAMTWSLGAMLAGLAGILFSPLLGLDSIILTLLVVQAYAAAVFGRLTSLPLAFAGAMALGLAQSLSVKVFASTPDFLNGLRQSLPFLFLFGGLVLARSGRLRELGVSAPWTGTVRARAGSWLPVLVVLIPLTLVLSDARVFVLGNTIVLACAFLSITVLTGSSGLVSLAQAGLVGTGAFSYIHLVNGGVPFWRRSSSAVCSSCLSASRSPFRRCDCPASSSLWRRSRSDSSSTACCSAPGVGSPARATGCEGRGRPCSRPTAPTCCTSSLPSPIFWPASVGCAAPGSAALSSRCATARPPPTRSASTRSGPGSRSSRCRRSLPASPAGCTPACSNRRARSSSPPSRRCCGSRSSSSVAIESPYGAILGAFLFFFLPDLVGSGDDTPVWLTSVFGMAAILLARRPGGLVGMIIERWPRSSGDAIRRRSGTEVSAGA